MTSDAVLIDAIDRSFGGEKRPKRIGVAVSGGSDSLALLHLLHDWGRVPVSAATLDHGLRPEAADEAVRVAKICDRLGIEHSTLKWLGWDGKGNLQDQARRTRYALLADWARDTGCDVVCLGHTLDDQVETFLMRLARSSGVDGLSGMEHRIYRHDVRFERPLLTERRADLRAYLTRIGVEWIDDPSNEDERFDRVKARKALGVLEDIGLTADAIEGSMVNLRLASLELRDLARETAGRICKEPGGDVVFDRAAFRRLNPEMQHRLLSKVLMFVSSEEYPPRREPMWDAQMAVIEASNRSLHGCLILVSNMTVRITREYNAVKDLTTPTNQPWDTRWDLDGPHAADLEIRALGEAVKECPDWRETGMPRQSLLSSPAVWRGETLIAAPVAGLSEGWTANATGRGKFTEFLISR